MNFNCLSGDIQEAEGGSGEPGQHQPAGSRSRTGGCALWAAPTQVHGYTAALDPHQLRYCPVLKGQQHYDVLAALSNVPAPHCIHLLPPIFLASKQHADWLAPTCEECSQKSCSFKEPVFVVIF